MKPLRRDPIGPLLAADDAALRSMARRELLGETMPRSARRSVPAWAGLSPGSSPMAGGSTRAGTRTSAPGRRMTSWRPTASSACWSCKFGLDRQHPAVAAAAGFLSSCQTEAPTRSLPCRSRGDRRRPGSDLRPVAEVTLGDGRASSSARSPNPSALIDLAGEASVARRRLGHPRLDLDPWSASGLGGSPTRPLEQLRRPGRSSSACSSTKRRAAAATARRRRRCRGPPA